MQVGTGDPAWTRLFRSNQVSYLCSPSAREHCITYSVRPFSESSRSLRQTYANSPSRSEAALASAPCGTLCGLEKRLGTQQSKMTCEATRCVFMRKPFPSKLWFVSTAFFSMSALRSCIVLNDTLLLSSAVADLRSIWIVTC